MKPRPAYVLSLLGASLALFFGVCLVVRAALLGPGSGTWPLILGAICLMSVPGLILIAVTAHLKANERDAILAVKAMLDDFEQSQGLPAPIQHDQSHPRSIV